METLFTIGHSNHLPENFLSLLTQYRIHVLLDVRSVPYSQYTQQFNRETIKTTLASHCIRYVFMGDRFGARPDDPHLYSSDGCLDFDKVRNSPRFVQGVENVLSGLRQGNRIVLMCTERDPLDCHRAILVARSFVQQGVETAHILPDGTLQTHQELEVRLLQRYFPERMQLSLLNSDTNEQSIDYLQRAYRMRNREIGYHK